MKVTAPDGRVWEVERRWFPWRFRFRLRRGFRLAREMGDGADILEPLGCLPEPIAIVFVVVAGLILVVIAILFVLPVLVAVLELTLLALLLLVGIAIRIVLRRPWIVDAYVVGSVGTPMSFKVVGWRRSGEVIREVGQQLEAGLTAIRPADAEPC